MNWFERYGIVGAYFCLMALFWLSVFFGFQLIKDNKEIIFGIVTLSFTPIGYLLTIFSQWFYYAGRWRDQIHKQVARFYYEGKNLLLDEATLETRLTVELRSGRLVNIGLENLKYIAKFATKRFDVIAINDSIIISTILLFIAVITFIFGLFSYCIEINNYSSFVNNNWYLIDISFISSFLIIWSCKKSKKIFKKQLYEIHREFQSQKFKM